MALLDFGQGRCICFGRFFGQTRAVIGFELVIVGLETLAQYRPGLGRRVTMPFRHLGIATFPSTTHFRVSYGGPFFAPRRHLVKPSRKNRVSRSSYFVVADTPTLQELSSKLTIIIRPARIACLLSGSPHKLSSPGQCSSCEV